MALKIPRKYALISQLSLRAYNFGLKPLNMTNLLLRVTCADELCGKTWLPEMEG